METRGRTSRAEWQAVAATATAFELELGADRKLRIPPQFDAGALERLLTVLERR